jgi:hypothetical protein
MTPMLIATNADPIAPPAYPPDPPTLRQRALTARTRWGKRVQSASRTLARRVPDRFTLSQCAGAATASGGMYVLWGLGVMLLALGLSVVAASVIVERRH